MPPLFPSGCFVATAVSLSVFPLSCPYSAIIPNVYAILWNSLSHRSESSKLHFTIIIPLGPSILSTR
jgi:hypothetical protein